MSQSMFCRQCEQTAKGTGCNLHGVCGKDDRTAILQDLLIYAVKGIAVWGEKARQLGIKDEILDRFIAEALFTTVTNVNFDPERIVSIIKETYDHKEKIKQKFLRAKQPRETEIISVLRSPNRRFQRVGLVAMSLKPIETDQLIDILFGFLRYQEPEFRLYAMISLDKFTKFPEFRKADLGKQLLEIIKNEKDDALPLFEQFDLLVRFRPEGTAQFLTELIMKEGKESRIRIFRHLAFRALKEMSGSYYDEAAEYVNKHGSAEIKKELLEREISREEIKSLTEKE